jgi:hypothetical protein
MTAAMPRSLRWAVLFAGAAKPALAAASRRVVRGDLDTQRSTCLHESSPAAGSGCERCSFQSAERSIGPGLLAGGAAADPHWITGPSARLVSPANWAREGKEFVVKKKQFSVEQIVAVSKQAERGMPATTYSPDFRATSDFSADYHQQNLAKNPNLYRGIGGCAGLDAGGIGKARAKTADRSELHRDSAI